MTLILSPILIAVSTPEMRYLKTVAPAVVHTVLLWVALLSSSGAWAAVPAGVDLIYIIDQSGSMMGMGSTTVRNDPFGKRIEALRALDDQLVRSAKLGMTNRISVIEFGGRNATYQVSRPQVTVTREVIPPIAHPSGEGAVRKMIQDHLNEVTTTFRGDTDHADALRLARIEVEHLQSNPPAFKPGGFNGIREVIVIMVTDGASYSKWMSAESLKREAIEEITALKSAADHTHFAVFGINDASRYWQEGWGGFWRALASKDPIDGRGHAWLLRSADDAVDKITSVLTELIPPATATTTNTAFAMPGYVKGVAFNVDFKFPNIPLSTINITDPDGTRYPLTLQNQLLAERYVSYPKPGIWQLATADALYSVTTTLESEQARLIEPPPLISQHANYLIRYQLSGRGAGGAFRDEPSLPPLDFIVTVESPSGQQQSDTMSLNRSTGEVSATRSWNFAEQGTYYLRLVGTTQSADGSRHEVYRSAAARGDAIAVNATDPVELRVDRPAVDSQLKLFFGGTKLPLLLRFYDIRTGAVRPPEQALKSGAQLAIAARFEDQPSGEAIPLTIEGDALKATVPIEVGERFWQLFSRDGDLFLELALPPTDPWSRDIYFSGIRPGSSLLVSDPIALREGLWSAFIMLVVAIAVAVGLYLIYDRLILPWRIAETDRKLKRSPRLLYRVHNHPQAEVVWPLGTQRVLRPSKRKVSLGDDAELWEIKHFKIERRPSWGEQLIVQLTYQPQDDDEPRVNEILKAQDDTGYSDARHNIKGLKDSQRFANFVLMVGQRD